MGNRQKHKRIALCPNCNSPNIKRGRMYGQYSGICIDNQDCRSWWPWKERLLVSPDKPLPKIVNRRKSARLKRDIIATITVTLVVVVIAAGIIFIL
jgi:hypothetical protein